MELNKLSRTCSMHELGSVDTNEIRFNFKENLGRLVRNVLGNNPKNRAILYNTNYTWYNNFDLRRILYKAGFRKVASYKGNGYNKVSVLIKKY